MKTKTLFTVLLTTFILASCAPRIETVSTDIVFPTKTTIPTSTSTLVPTVTMTKTPLPTSTTIPTSTSTLVPTVTMTKTPLPTSTSYPLKGSCPLELSQDGVDIFAGYNSSTHLGMDIAAPEGTPHISPGDCTILYFYIQDDGGQGVQLRCANLPSVDRISLHHIDLSQLNYETLDYYGIPKSDVYNDDGTVKIGQFGFDLPNAFTAWGENLHIYSGNTGKSGLPHTHISIWTLTNGDLDDHNDPLEYLECHE